MYLPWNTKEVMKDSDIQESQIKAGDQLSVTCHGEKKAQTKQIRVNAILRASLKKYTPTLSGRHRHLCSHGKEFLETMA